MRCSQTSAHCAGATTHITLARMPHLQQQCCTAAAQLPTDPTDQTCTPTVRPIAHSQEHTRVKNLRLPGNLVEVVDLLYYLQHCARTNTCKYLLVNAHAQQQGGRTSV